MEDLKEHILEDLVRKVVIEGIFSAAIKLGSLEKTVIASLFHSSLHSGTIFCGKNDDICYFVVF